MTGEQVPRATSKLELPESTVIRKTPYGRANLYMEGATFGFSNIRCSSSITRDSKDASVFIPHLSSRMEGKDWEKGTEIHCWHCCEGFSTPPVPIPRSFDAKEGKYVVYGTFCSLSCAKGHLKESVSFEHGQQVNTLMKMARDVYGRTEVKAAPPRCTLKKFGGPYSIQEFRSNAKEVAVHSAPFICNYMVVEECAADTSNLADTWKNSIRGLRRPSQPLKIGNAQEGKKTCPYDDFVTKKSNEVCSQSQGQEAGPSQPPPPPPPPKPKPKEGLERFMKK